MGPQPTTVFDCRSIVRYGLSPVARFRGSAKPSARLLLIRLLGAGIVFLILQSAAMSAWALEIEMERGRQPVLSDTRAFVETQPLTIAEAMAIPGGRWRPVSGMINAGFTNTPHWYRIPLHNGGAESVERLLEIAYPLLDHIAFYEVADGQVLETFRTGDSLPFSKRPLEHRNFVFPIEIPAGETHEIYLRVSTSGALQVPLMLWKEREFHAASEIGMAWRTLFYGALLTMAAFNLFLYFSLRERAYAYYVAVVLATLLLMSGMHGFSFQYLFPTLPRVHQLTIVVGVPLCQIALSLFTMEFLSLRTAAPRWYRIFRILVGLAVLCLICAFVLPYSVSSLTSVLFSLPLLGANLVVGLSIWRQGEMNLRLFSAAWMIFLAGAVVTILSKLSVLPATFLTEHAIPIGATLQALLFSFALADRFQRERKALFEAQQESYAAMRQRRKAEAQLLHAASHHELTGLPNRLLFERVVQSYLDSPPEEASQTGVVLLHLQRFDEVNKTLGHNNSDHLIRQIAGRLNRMLPSCPGMVQLEAGEGLPVFAAHVEGVSFAFAVSGRSCDAVMNEVAALARQLARPIEFMGLSLDLNFAIGCSFAGAGDDDPQTLLRQAFVAFDQADREAGGIAVYEPGMNPYSPRRLTLMTELRAAIGDDSLTLFFQPQLHLGSQRIAGFEALLRWSHPEYGFIPPDEFIPMAEQTGLIKPLTQWVIQHALVFCKDLDRAGCDATVSVNISAVNLREPGFCEQLCTLLTEQGVAAQRLVLEVTETAAMTDPKSALVVLRALQAASVRLSIDDFGTGHSSLSYIRKLPVQEIKIDRSFVMEMATNQGDATIVRTTVNMCHDLGYEVVAEGVENQATLELLRELGCDIIQGYHLARPMDRETALDWLARSEWQKRKVSDTAG